MFVMETSAVTYPRSHHWLETKEGEKYKFEVVRTMQVQIWYPNVENKLTKFVMHDICFIKIIFIDI